MTTQPADEDILIQVPGRASGTVKDAPRGVVTLCETPGCDYAAARVTRPSGATSAE